MPDFTYTLFATDVAILVALLAGVLWSIWVPDKRIWPPPRQRSWQWVLAWTGCSAACGLNVTLLFLDWNTWRFPSYIRFVAGVPPTLLGGLIAIWGVIALVVKNSAGLKGGFVLAGPYRFTRNPQYLGDVMIFVGVSFIANSLFLWVTHVLLSFVYVLAAIAEERWLEQQYGEVYREYRRATPRFWPRSPRGQT